MKKVRVMIVLLLLCSAVCLWAVEENETVEASNTGEELSGTEVSMLIEKDLFKNSLLIANASQFLTSKQKKMLFIQNQKTSTMPCLLNGLLGFGIGSYVQGDMKTGLICTVGDLVLGVSTTCFYTLYVSAQSGYESYKFRTDDWKYEQTLARKRDSRDRFFGAVIVSGIAFLGFRIFEISRPFSYTKKYNNTLIEALGLYDVALNLTPTIDVNGNIQTSLVCKLKL